MTPLLQLSQKPRAAEPPSAAFRWYLEYAFRPFFLLSGLYASVSLLAWVLTLLGVWQLPTSWSPTAWHAHEMVFGFGGAAVAGFLLTAVPAWTQTLAVRGPALGVLVLTWLLGRTALWTSAWLPGSIVAALDLTHVPVLAWLVLGPIVRSRNQRNYAFIALLTVLFAANALMHAQALGLTSPAIAAPRIGVWVLVVMVTIVSGRIVPSFTRNYLRLLGVPETSLSEAPTPRALELASIAAVISVGIAECAYAPPLVRGSLAALAAVALFARSARWGALRSWRSPIVWILHVGHAWLVVAMALLALDGLGVLAVGGSALHALTAGAIGTMILAVMSRASLGHTGRALEVSTTTVAAYVAVTLGTSVRVFAPLVWPASYVHSVATGGVLWAAGFALFVIAYAPVLTRPRPDGRPG